MPSRMVNLERDLPKLHRFFRTDADNAAAVRLCQKLGFVIQAEDVGGSIVL